MSNHIEEVTQQLARAAMGDLPSEPDVRQVVLHACGADRMTFMEPAEAFDDCIVGVADTGSEFVAVYNKNAVIASLANHDGVSFEEAFDKFNKGWRLNHGMRLKDADGSEMPQTPLFITDVRDL